MLSIQRPVPPRALYAYAASLTVAGGTLALALLANGARLEAPLWALAVLAAAATLAERQSVRISSNTEVNVAAVPVAFAAVVYGPLTAMAVAAVGMLTQVGTPYVRWIIWTAVAVLAAGFAGTAASFFASADPGIQALLMASIAAVVTEAFVNSSLSAVTLTLRGTGSLRDSARTMGPVMLATVPLYGPAITLLAYLYLEVSAWTVPLFVAPAFAAHRFYNLYREQRDATDRLTAVNERLSRANISFATALVTALDARDRYTAGHSAAVAVYARDIAARMALGEDQRQLAHLCGLVHDIGKIGLPVGLLEKRGPLTLEERRKMQQHSEIGERILKKVEDYERVATIVRHHHERVDGHGYPDGLSQEEIPLISRIIAVADAYDAMTSDRPYREAMPSGVARLRLAQAVDSQFDTSVVAAFEAILAGSTEEYRSARRRDFNLRDQERPYAVHALPGQ